MKEMCPVCGVYRKNVKLHLRYRHKEVVEAWRRMLDYIYRIRRV